MKKFNIILLSLLVAFIPFVKAASDTEATIQTRAGGSIKFNNTTNTYATTLSATAATANNTITVPDATGTMQVSGARDAANAVTVVSNGVEFEGATANASEGTLAPADVTADRTWTLPDQTGTIITTAAGGTTSANLTSMITDETGSGVAVFATTPTLVTPVIGAATGTSLLLSGAISAGKVNFCADAGSNDTYTCNFSPAIAAYTTGQVIMFTAATANTGAASIAINGLAALPLKKGVATDPGDNFIKAGQVVSCVYDGTNCQMTQPASI